MPTPDSSTKKSSLESADPLVRAKAAREWPPEDQAALEKLVPLVYAELRKMAKRYMSRQHPGHTL